MGRLGCLLPSPYLAGGIEQRLLASLGMRTGSRVLIEDEPTKGLDEGRRAELTGRASHPRRMLQSPGVRANSIWFSPSPCNYDAKAGL